jgi:hypothetical protein
MLPRSSISGKGTALDVYLADLVVLRVEPVIAESTPLSLNLEIVFVARIISISIAV